MGVTSLVFGILALCCSVFGMAVGPFGPGAGFLFSILAIALGSPAAKMHSKAGKVGKGLGIFSLIWVLVIVILIILIVILGGSFLSNLPVVGDFFSKIADGLSSIKGAIGR
ncbi:MAG: hypothetical protein MJ184_05155 [Treponema sp.]|uniref:hypothetical protein n=1 Tax=Treponema sp. TaxID=166 RepID=UPI00298E3A3C|nr:hypothetical protein [Treponema sp.]MCQ2600729.1 hypothetical protein [Treponema sp.]